MDEPTDAVLVLRARAGDKEAFGVLVGRHAPMAERLARRLVGDGDLARDLAQDALLQAYLSADRLRDPARFRSWLYGIVLHGCRQALRARRNPPALSWEELPGGLRFDLIPWAASDLDPHAIVEARELHRRVLAAVDVLPPKIRAATLLFYYEQLSVQEVAAILGISVAAVKSRLFQARKHLRAHLERIDPEWAAVAPSAPPAARAPERRKSAMVPVTIADVVMRETPEGQQYVVVLWDEAGRRLLPIWVGPPEGAAIAMGLRQVPTPRPVTYPFIANLLAAAGAGVEAVTIGSLEDSVYYATVRLRQNGTVQEVDARPSDALALATRTGSAITVAEAVLAASGIAVAAAQAGPPPGRGADAIVRDLQAQWAAMPIPPTPAPEAKAEREQEFLAFLFGGEQPGG